MFSDYLRKSKTKSVFASYLGGSASAKPDLTTTEGLVKTATQYGLGERARQITQPAEKPKEIFSGGVISDIFDGLNIFQYGVVGLLKGKSFGEGVKTRQSFTDKDALGDYGIPGLIGGIALDIACDPLTYIAPTTILKKIPVAGELIAKYGDEAVDVAKATFFKSRLGQSLGKSFIYRFGQDKVYKELAERMTRSVGTGTQNLLDLARPLTKLDPDVQVKIANARKLGKLDDLPKELLSKAKPVFDELDILGKKAVDVGLLPKEVYEANVGKYMARLYKDFESPGVVKKVKQFFTGKKPMRIDIDRFMKRGDIAEDVREAMGEILQAGFPTAKSLVQINSAVEHATFFNKVSKTFAKDVVEEGFKKLPDTKRLGALSGKFVPEAIFDDIQEIIRVRGTGEKALNKVIGTWKFGKVVMNPATHCRNVISNFILNNFEGLSPHRLDIYVEAGKQLAKGSGKYLDEAKKVGLGMNTFASQELKSILTSPDGASGLKKLGKGLGKFVDKISNIYQKEEEWAKLSQYIFQRSVKNLSPDDAWKVAERATFNYAQITPFIRRLRESVFGYPFITFSYKATGQVVKTALTHPTRISNIGKIKTAIENMADLKELERERATEPAWVRDGFYIKLPIKDKYDRSAYLDLSYIMPFGDLISGQYTQRSIKSKTGLPESYPEAIIKKSPFINLITEVATNQDFYGNKIFLESDDTQKQLGDLFRHLVKFYSPPLIADQIPGGYQYSKETKKLERRKGMIERALAKEKGATTSGMQDRTLMQELLRNVGLKISPVDIDYQEKISQYYDNKALRTLMEEAGIINEFTLPYITQTQKTTGGGFADYLK